MDPILLPDHIFPPSYSLEEGAMEWGFMFAPCTDPHVALDIDPDMNLDMDLHLVPDLSLDLDLDALAEATAPTSTTAQDFPSPPTVPPTTVSDSRDDHDASMLDLPVLPQSFSHHQSTNAFPPSMFCNTLKPIPHPSELCIEQQHHTTCMITATKTLRSLHIIQTSCLSSTNGGSNNNNDSRSRSQGQRGPDPPRKTGQVLKGNKEAGMTVCRMLQCVCALRPQNQLVLAIICARLVAWYRALIRACFMQWAPQAEDASSRERVLHEPITIGNHSVDRTLEWTFQAQVVLLELRHLQRLVETLSIRIREAGAQSRRDPSSSSTDGQGSRQDRHGPGTGTAGLPGIVHDRLVLSLLQQVQAAKTDLMTAWRKP